ncbi:hypothetical protein SAMN05421858_3484 [Haladaptatus litoreus]|uniref:Uncharacterized protein n=1 Tax=Haladaptatus litoreus TaxID=553468 RepID=A0A1N7DBJ9_9EURY|nr:hypothetical protein SAMN05421858_3484 [Haladaptatus litoreus]
MEGDTVACPICDHLTSDWGLTIYFENVVGVLFNSKQGYTVKLSLGHKLSNFLSTSLANFEGRYCISRILKHAYLLNLYKYN